MIQIEPAEGFDTSNAKPFFANKKIQPQQITTLCKKDHRTKPKQKEDTEAERLRFYISESNEGNKLTAKQDGFGTVMNRSQKGKSIRIRLQVDKFDKYFQHPESISVFRHLTKKVVEQHNQQSEAAKRNKTSSNKYVFTIFRTKQSKRI